MSLLQVSCRNGRWYKKRRYLPQLVRFSGEILSKGLRQNVHRGWASGSYGAEAVLKITLM